MKTMPPPQPTHPISTGWQVQWHHRCNGKPRWDVIQKYFSYNKDINYWTHLHHQGSKYKLLHILYHLHTKTMTKQHSSKTKRQRECETTRQDVHWNAVAVVVVFRPIVSKVVQCLTKLWFLPNQCAKQTVQPLSQPTSFLTYLKGAFNHRCVCDPEEEHAALHDSGKQG